jgi:hypothetical protein
MVCESFLDCESLNISGNAQGIFTLSFDYYALSDTLSGDLSSIQIEVNNKIFNGYVLSHQIKKTSGLPPSASCVYWIHSLQITATTTV